MSENSTEFFLEARDCYYDFWILQETFFGKILSKYIPIICLECSGFFHLVFLIFYAGKMILDTSYRSELFSI